MDRRAVHERAAGPRGILLAIEEAETCATLLDSSLSQRFLYENGSQGSETWICCGSSPSTYANQGDRSARAGALGASAPQVA
jgi:hypothetical protein